MVTTPVKIYAAAIAPATMTSSKHQTQYPFFWKQMLPTSVVSNNGLGDSQSKRAVKRGPDQTCPVH